MVAAISRANPLDVEIEVASGADIALKRKGSLTAKKRA